MTTTSDRFGRVAGACLVAAGALFIGVQINHPPLTLDVVSSPEFFVRQLLKTVMTVLALAGIAALHLAHRRRTGVLGLIAWVLFSVGYLAMFAVEAIAGFALPGIVKTSPDWVQDVLAAAVGGTPAGDVGAMNILFGLSAVGYMLGGLGFGIALFRAGVVARWASLLLAVATVGTAALSVLPEAFNRPFAVPVGIALIGLGWSSWRTWAASPAGASVSVAEPVTR